MNSTETDPERAGAVRICRAPEGHPKESSASQLGNAVCINNTLLFLDSVGADED